MRTHILIAAALALSATTVHAAPRSLSAPQSNPVQTAPEAAKPADAPVFKVQSNEEAKPSEQPQAAPQPAPPPSVQAAPAAPPADTGVARSAELSLPRHRLHRRQSPCDRPSASKGTGN